MKEFRISIDILQPTQLYLSKTKLDAVMDDFQEYGPDALQPLPVRDIGGSLLLTDGHTRAYVLYVNGIRDIWVYRDDEDLNWKEYLICRKWSLENNLHHIKRLGDRICDADYYKQVWIAMCQSMHESVKMNDYYQQDIVFIRDEKQKALIARNILQSLHEWNGIDRIINEYVAECSYSDFYACMVADVPVGFAAVKRRFKDVAEIYLVSMLNEFKNTTAGQQLYNEVEKDLLNNNIKIVSVKATQLPNDSDMDVHTAGFYKKMGYLVIDNLRHRWVDGAECLLMVKSLQKKDDK